MKREYPFGKIYRSIQILLLTLNIQLRNPFWNKITQIH